VWNEVIAWRGDVWEKEIAAEGRNACCGWSAGESDIASEDMKGQSHGEWKWHRQIVGNG
jgi:hypothetical protein